MSELKVYHCNEWHNEYTEFYRKDEVKKVIKKLEKSHKRAVEQLLIEIEELKADYKEACGRLQTANLIKDEQLAATRHHKYKRCLNMSKWCASECVVNQNTNKRFLTHKSDFRIGHFRKWYKRWLELAEKFKEAK